MLSKFNLLISTRASKEESRFTLNGILVAPDVTVETDGHQLILMPTPLHGLSKDAIKGKLNAAPEICGMHPIGTWKPFILPAKDCNEILKAIPKRTNIPIIKNAFVLEQTDDCVKIGVTDLETPRIFNCKPLSGNFPDYERVIPKVAEAPFRIGMNAALLRDVLDTMAKCGDERCPGVVFHFKDNTSAVTITGKDPSGQPHTAVCMPLRVDGADKLINAPAIFALPSVGTDHKANGIPAPPIAPQVGTDALAVKIVHGLLTYMNETGAEARMEKMEEIVRFSLGQRAAQRAAQRLNVSLSREVN